MRRQVALHASHSRKRWTGTTARAMDLEQVPQLCLWRRRLGETQSVAKAELSFTQQPNGFTSDHSSTVEERSFSAAYSRPLGGAALQRCNKPMDQSNQPSAPQFCLPERSKPIRPRNRLRSRRAPLSARATKARHFHHCPAMASRVEVRFQLSSMSQSSPRTQRMADTLPLRKPQSQSVVTFDMRLFLPNLFSASRLPLSMPLMMSSDVPLSR